MVGPEKASEKPLHWTIFWGIKRHTTPSKPCEVWKVYPNLAKAKGFHWKVVQRNADELVRTCIPRDLAYWCKQFVFQLIANGNMLEIFIMVTLAKK